MPKDVALSMQGVWSEWVSLLRSKEAAGEQREDRREDVIRIEDAIKVIVYIYMSYTLHIEVDASKQCITISGGGDAFFTMLFDNAPSLQSSFRSPKVAIGS